MSEVNKAVNELKEGNESSFESLIEKAAKANEVGPEHMKKIVESLF